MKKIMSLLLTVALIGIFVPVQADDYLPEDNSFIKYHTAPRYRTSEEHPVRLLAYVFHPIGWVARELITRPISYFVSSTEERSSIFGYREPGDWRQPSCFSGSNAVPDCRSIKPYNYARSGSGGYLGGGPEIMFPNVNFDFDRATLNSMGVAKTEEIASALGSAPGVVVVLEGHTDYIGSNQYNNDLGMRRAEAVRAALVGLGVSAARLSTVTFGKTQPLINDKTSAARAANRRVEVHQDQ